MSNHFNELLLQTLKDVGIRLERLEGRVDHVINEKADRIDVKDVIKKLDQKADKADLKAISETLDQKADKSDVEAVKSDVEAVKSDVSTLHDEVRSHGQHLDRIETGIKTLQWTMTAGLAVLGIILAFMRSC